MAGYPHPPSREDTDVIGRRVIAQIIDTIVAGFIVGLFFGLSVPDSLTFLFFVGVLASLAYWFLLEGVWDGKTVGKALTGIKTVKEDGSECSVGAAVVRNLLDILDGLFYYLVGFLVMAFSDNRQRIGDRLAGTMVVSSEPISSGEATETASESQIPETSSGTGVS
jgi:uncharacterized RDD family membrane protein YckC